MRKDLLVSIGVIDEGNPLAILDRIETLTATLSRRFQYFEVVLIVAESRRGVLEQAGGRLSALTNLRIILVGDGTRYYQRRLIAASEAIGDVIAIIDFDDFTIEALCDHAEASKDANEILIGWGKTAPMAGLPHRLLSLLSRHNVAPQALRTILLPRERLNAVLARHSAVLDLRFEPRASHIQYRRVPATHRRRRTGSLAQRYELLTEILMTGAPRYLKVYAASAFLVASIAIIYAIYAVLVMIWQENVQPGWFSTSMVQSGSVFFIATGMSVLALAIAGLVERLGGGESNAIAGEIANIDFFDHQHDLNVELGSSASGGEPQQDTLRET